MSNLPRVAVWGLGSHAIKRILPALKSCEDVSLYGVCSRSGEVVGQCAEQWSCVGWVDAELMLADPKVDIVYLATPIGLHAVQGKRILIAGKHLWCEKPLTCNKADTQMLVQLAQDQDLMLVECLMYLYHPQFTSVERIVREQELGAVKTLTCKFGIPFLEKPGFRFDPALCGGAFWDVGYYPVSTVLALFPDEDIEVHVAQLYGRKGYSVDFDGMALLRSSEGATISLQWSIGSSYRNELDIWAEQGSVFTDKIYSKSANYSPVLQFRNLNGTESSVAVEETEQFAEMFVCFSEILSNNTMRRLELDRIEKRASLMEKILNHANANRVDLDQSINEQTQY